jgi:hypothetical protein
MLRHRDCLTSLLGTRLCGGRGLYRGLHRGFYGGFRGGFRFYRCLRGFRGRLCRFFRRLCGFFFNGVLWDLLFQFGQSSGLAKARRCFYRDPAKAA